MYVSVRPRDTPSSARVTRLLSVLALLVVIVVGSAAATASALAGVDDGVHIDPGSAPATEYALPLDSARDIGSPSGTGETSGDTDARPPAFGSGITARPGRSTSGSGPGGGTGNTAGNPSNSAGSDGDGAGGRAPAPTSSGDGSGDPLRYSLGGGIVVLVAGGLVALTLRRRQSPA